MTIGDAAPVANANGFSVKLVKGQEDQQSKVVQTLIDSSAPTAPGVGKLLNTTA